MTKLLGRYGVERAILPETRSSLGVIELESVLSTTVEGDCEAGRGDLGLGMTKGDH